MPVTWHQDASGSVARLEGDIDVACSGEMKRLLIEAFASSHAVRVNLSLAGDLDITAIQLLWAAMAEAKRTGSSFLIEGNRPPGLEGMLQDISLENFLRGLSDGHPAHPVDLSSNDLSAEEPASVAGKLPANRG